MMSLLVRSFWRTVVTSVSLKKTISPLRCLCSAVETTQGKTNDLVLNSLRTAPRPADVLAAVQANLNVMTHKHLLQALTCLFQMSKDGRLNENSQELGGNPIFNTLCQNLRKNARALEVNDTVEAAKLLIYLNVPIDSVYVQTMLQMIRSNINNLNIRQIMFLDYILGKCNQQNHLVDALKLALPLVFQIHLPLEIDNDDLPLLRDMLGYACYHNLPERSVNNVVTGLLLHHQVLDAQSAKSIVWSLCHINCDAQQFPTRYQLLHTCYDILITSSNRLSYEDVLRTSMKIKEQIVKKHPEFYREQLLDAFATYVVKNELTFEKGLLIARVLSRIAHTNLTLIDYLCQQASSNPTALSNARVSVIFGFVNCLSNSNYTPEPKQYAEIMRQISLHPILDMTTTALPWMKFCLELASLGFYSDKLLAKIFSKGFLDDYLSRQTRTIDYLQLLMVYEAAHAFHTNKKYSIPNEVLEKAKSVYPVSMTSDELEKHLALGLGGPEYVVKNVVLPNGFVADAFVCLKAGYPVKLPTFEGNIKVPVQKLNLPAGSIPVCVMNFKPGCYSMNSNRLRGTFRLVVDIIENDGYACVPVNIAEWLKAPSRERAPYLVREMGYKCGELCLKLKATIPLDL